MKFQCVPCERPMTLSATERPDAGSFRLVYACPDCGYEMAMVTNAFETQLVSSLGVKIEAQGGAAVASGSKCPFAAMTQGPGASVEIPAGVRWSEGAEARLESIPSFVRPMAKSGIEQFAREQGYVEVDERVLDEARSRFGM